MWNRLKSDRRAQFAAGLAIVLVAAKWLFTGSLFYAAADMQREPADGQTSAGLAVTSVLPVVIDAAVGLLVFVGAWVLNAGEWLFSRISSANDPPVTATDQLVQSGESDPSDMRSLIIALGDAAAMNDLESLEKLRVRIRKPYALVELQQAYEKNDLDAVGELVAELNKMHAMPAAAAKAKRGGQQ